MDEYPNAPGKELIWDVLEAGELGIKASKLFMKSEADCCEAGVSKLDKFPPPFICASALLIAADKLLLLLTDPAEDDCASYVVADAASLVAAAAEGTDDVVALLFWYVFIPTDEIDMFPPKFVNGIPAYEYLTTGSGENLDSTRKSSFFRYSGALQDHQR